jgi:hypothetical protein
MYGNPCENQPRFTISYHKCKTAFGAFKTSFSAFLSLSKFNKAATTPGFAKVAAVFNEHRSKCLRAAAPRMLHLLRPDFARRKTWDGRTFVGVMRSHSLFRRLVSVVLAVLVLITSVGLTVQRLTCRMSGRSTVAVSVAGRAELRGCLGELAPATPKAADGCCDFSKHEHKLNSPVHEMAAKILVPVPALLAPLPQLSWPVSKAAVSLAARAPRWFAADASPPPLGGRTLLAFACMLEV